MLKAFDGNQMYLFINFEREMLPSEMSCGLKISDRNLIIYHYFSSVYRKNFPVASREIADALSRIRLL